MASIDCNECERSGGRDNPSSITMPWMNMFIIYRNVFRWMYCRVASFTYLIVCFLLAPAPVESFYERRVNSPFDNAKSGAVFGVFFFLFFFCSWLVLASTGLFFRLFSLTRFWSGKKWGCRFHFTVSRAWRAIKRGRKCSGFSGKYRKFFLRIIISIVWGGKQQQIFRQL